MKEVEPTILGREEKNKAEEHIKVLASIRVKEAVEPHYEIDIPDEVINLLGISNEDTIDFIEENDRIYIKKA